MQGLRPSHALCAATACARRSRSTAGDEGGNDADLCLPGGQRRVARADDQLNTVADDGVGGGRLSQYREWTSRCWG